MVKIENKPKLTARELIDIICPKHDRSSCSDDNIDNGLYSSTNHTRCVRCTFLEILKEGFIPKDHKFIGYFNIKRTKENKDKFALREEDY